MNEEISKSIMKSNTSLVGIVCKDGVILGADRRSTAGNIIMNKDSRKIHEINEYLAASYTGGVADIQLTNKVLSAELKLKDLRTKSRATIKEAASFLSMMVYRNIRNPSMIPSIVGTLVAGMDEDGTTSLYTIEPAGGVQKVADFDANFSSGMPYIMGFLERNWVKGISVEEGIELATEALKASTQRDVGSGNGIDVYKITKEGIQHVVSQEISPEYK